MAIILIGNHGGGRLRPGGQNGKTVPPNAQRQSPAALTAALAVESFLARDWSENTRRNFASDLKRFREAGGRRRVGRLKPEELACLPLSLSLS